MVLHERIIHPAGLGYVPNPGTESKYGTSMCAPLNLIDFDEE